MATGLGDARGLMDDLEELDEVRDIRQSGVYRSDLSKRPWVLGIHWSKIRGGRLHGEAICT